MAVPGSNGAGGTETPPAHVTCQGTRSPECPRGAEWGGLGSEGGPRPPSSCCRLGMAWEQRRPRGLTRQRPFPCRWGARGGPTALTQSPRNPDVKQMWGREPGAGSCVPAPAPWARGGGLGTGAWGELGGPRRMGGLQYLVAVRHPVESLHQVGRPLQQDLLGRERRGLRGAAPPPRPRLHRGDMQAPCPATAPCWGHVPTPVTHPHAGDTSPRWHPPEPPWNAQSPSTAQHPTADPWGWDPAGTHCVPPRPWDPAGTHCVPPRPSLRPPWPSLAPLHGPPCPSVLWHCQGRPPGSERGGSQHPWEMGCPCLHPWVSPGMAESRAQYPPQTPGRGSLPWAGAQGPRGAGG